MLHRLDKFDGPVFVGRHIYWGPYIWDVNWVTYQGIVYSGGGGGAYIWEHSNTILQYERISLISVLLLLLVNFVSGFRQELMYIYLIIFIRSNFTHLHHSSSWFSAAFAAAIAHRNHFFHLYQQNKSSESKVRFREAINLQKGS